MDGFSDRMHDPLLFLSNDKNDLDNFLFSGSDMEPHIINDDLQVHITDNSLDFDSLEGNGHLGDMNWLHNSSFSTLAHLDNDDTSDGSTMISVNPQSVLPMQVIEPSKPDNLLSSENANSAAMRLHANCSNLIGSSSPEESMKANNTSILNQEHPSIRILSVAGAVTTMSSPSKQTNFIITSTRDSPLKSQTFVLNTANGVITPGHSVVTTCSQNRGSNAGSANIMVASPQKLHSIGTDKKGRVLFKANNLLSPSQASPVLLGRLQTGVQAQLYQTAQVVSSTVTQSTAQQNSDMATVSSTTNYGEEKAYPKPVFSYSCLIALALKNSKNGSLPVSEIYTFMCENFPYFKTAPDGWKNSVRHNLSLNKCFAKVDNPKLSQGAKKGCLWALNPAKVTKMEDEISKWGKKDPAGLLNSMAYPENLEAIENGQAGLHYTKKISPHPVTPLKAEATPVKLEYSPISNSKHEFRPIRVERSHSNMSVHSMVQHVTPVKAKQEHVSQMRQAYSPAFQRHYTSSPMSNLDVYNHSPMKASSTADLNQKTFSINDIHSTINTDALTDIVLQNGIWESEDLENEINIDLICDSPSSQILLPIQSPLPHGASPHTVHSSINPGYCSPSIQAPFSNVVQSSPLPQSSPTPNSVRNNLFGVSTPTRRTLYT